MIYKYIAFIISLGFLVPFSIFEQCRLDKQNYGLVLNDAFDSCAGSSGRDQILSDNPETTLSCCIMISSRSEPS